MEGEEGEAEIIRGRERKGKKRKGSEGVVKGIGGMGVGVYVNERRRGGCNDGENSNES